jgi:hypothetical protein
MTDPKRIQLPPMEEIVSHATKAGLPSGLAENLGRAGGESRLPEEIMGVVTYLFFKRDGQPDRHNPHGLATTDLELATHLLRHYPQAVESMVPEPDQQAAVLELWAGGEQIAAHLGEATLREARASLMPQE